MSRQRETFCLVLLTLAACGERPPQIKTPGLDDLAAARHEAEAQIEASCPRAAACAGFDGRLVHVDTSRIYELVAARGYRTERAVQWELSGDHPTENNPLARTEVRICVAIHPDIDPTAQDCWVADLAAGERGSDGR